ncbi:hypothetical protein CEXT_431751 [Caerostris extrusa]|uniref:Uncharacterized protein n=1 Tax=Caerostris extrusa TaxID=172846 RepID=A0AAV4NKQ8_CAEEX|nr:hypothetical protein CEXT_431751 [Caerostris extrusa]
MHNAEVRTTFCIRLCKDRDVVNYLCRVKVADLWSAEVFRRGRGVPEQQRRGGIKFVFAGLRTLAGISQENVKASFDCRKIYGKLRSTCTGSCKTCAKCSKSRVSINRLIKY